ncbi:hypothetical protein BMI91_09500 [Thioclava sediminum]|uniref:Nucleoside 2-deoxyribosyltransferase n=1 Tax=Thioclava sediminum TaxID=1915319 RepID=A0ABX3MX73_9RHOB|nr:hypothetical protein [Thioclava sediminum]OOY24281.1 hypothetical protein BMI91_09500 [Thioclava sediminum]
MAEASKKKICGIVMPISECDGRPSSHWADVLSIIKNTATAADFEARLVSETFETNLIHKEILRNIYEDDVIVCDVSGRNPNVFFELGIRMATQKPTVVIKDNVTLYPFDTSVNRYIEYPRDLRHPLIEKFKADLTAMIKKVAAQKPEHSFIGQLGPFQVPNIESTEISASDAILEKIDSLARRIAHSEESQAMTVSRYVGKQRRSVFPSKDIRFHALDNNLTEVLITGFSEDDIERITKEIQRTGFWNVEFSEPHEVGPRDFVVLSQGTDVSSKNFQNEFRHLLEQEAL